MSDEKEAAPKLKQRKASEDKAGPATSDIDANEKEWLAFDYSKTWKATKTFDKGKASLHVVLEAHSSHSVIWRRNAVFWY
jgi:hypothetical protein